MYKHDKYKILKTFAKKFKNKNIHMSCYTNNLQK